MRWQSGVISIYSPSVFFQSTFAKSFCSAVVSHYTNLNIPSTQFPVRWLYPSAELDYNPDNVAAAIQSQYGGNDDVNALMWILKD